VCQTRRSRKIGIEKSNGGSHPSQDKKKPLNREPGRGGGNSASTILVGAGAAKEGENEGKPLPDAGSIASSQVLKRPREGRRKACWDKEEGDLLARQRTQKDEREVTILEKRSKRKRGKGGTALQKTTCEPPGRKSKKKARTYLAGSRDKRKAGEERGREKGKQNREKMKWKKGAQ